MRFTVTAYTAMLALVYAKNEFNTTCCDSDIVERQHSAGLQTQERTQFMELANSTVVPLPSDNTKDDTSSNYYMTSVRYRGGGYGSSRLQHRFQYSNQNRHPFQRYRPKTPKSAAQKHIVKGKNTTAQNFSSTPSTSPTPVDPTVFSMNETVGEMYFGQNESTRAVEAGNTVRPAFASYTAPSVSSNVSTIAVGSDPPSASNVVPPIHVNNTGNTLSTPNNQSQSITYKVYQTYKPVPVTEIAFNQSHIQKYGVGVQSSHGIGVVNQYTSQYSGQRRYPMQPYKPFIPLTQGPKVTFSSPPVIPATSDSSPRGPSLSQYQSQDTKRNLYPYQPYQPSIPNPDQTFESGSPPFSAPSIFSSPYDQSFFADYPSRPAYGQSGRQYDAQYVEDKRNTYQPYKPNIPAPFETVEPVLYNPSASDTSDVPNTSSSGIVTPQPAPSIGISIVSNGRNFFDEYTRRKDTLPLIKILINNVHNSNTL